MGKILFVNSINDASKDNNFSIGIFSLGTILKKEGYDVDIIDFNYLMGRSIIKDYGNSDDNLLGMCNYMLNLNPSVIDFYTMSNSYYLSIRLAKKIRELDPKIKIVFGGPQATLTAEATLRTCGEWVDIIGIGEGEKTISKIIGNLVNDIDFTDEKGVAYLKDGKFVYNEAELVKNLDELPKIDYSLLQGELTDGVHLDVGRGCPFGCKYCSTKTFWKRNFRLKSSERIIDEIRDIVTTFGIKKFVFEHDLFTANAERVKDFCNKLIDSNLNISWTCSSRADTLDEELIKLMKKSGCELIFLGIESGSPRIQKIINKNLSLNKALNTIVTLIRNNIKITVSFIYGFPEETEEDVNRTLDLIYLISKVGVQTSQLHLFSLFPGTEYCEELKDKLYFSEYISDGASSKYITAKDIEFIKDHEDIFTQYLEFDAPMRKSLTLIDIYVGVYMKLLARYFNDTYMALVTTVFGNHVRFFMKFKEVNEEKLYYYKKYIYKLELEPKFCIEGLEKLINTLDCENKEIIAEIFDFEKDIVNFIYYNSEKSICKDYKYDVYAVKAGKLPYKEIVESETSLCITRVNNQNDINIKKVERIIK